MASSDSLSLINKKFLIFFRLVRLEKFALPRSGAQRRSLMNAIVDDAKPWKSRNFALPENGYDSSPNPSIPLLCPVLILFKRKARC
jgi:hypothetical protein